MYKLLNNNNNNNNINYMINIDNIITGEKLQKISNLYIGEINDFLFNKNIYNDKQIKLDINKWNNTIDNPKIIFCYSHRIELLSQKINLFENDFILITHNSDYNISDLSFISNILNNNKLIKWFAQNITFEHYKLHLLPIGIANSMWPHGNLLNFTGSNIITNINYKKEYIYFNFNIETNREKRLICYNLLKNKIKWLDNINSKDNLLRLSSYKFCICPEGNGVDTHRIWECLYLKTIPIVLKNNFTEILKNKYNIPIILLNDWNDIFHEISNSNYLSLVEKLNNLDILSFTIIKTTIITHSIN